MSNFYKFLEICDVHAAGRELESWGVELKLSGLIILAEEGINGTIAGPREKVELFKERLHGRFPEAHIAYKEGVCAKDPFSRFKVKVRDEIVTTGAEQPNRVTGEVNKLSPAEWNQRLKNGGDHVLLDTRNVYETELGKFRGALDPGLNNFQEFSAFVERADIPKSKPVLMYCTGGIRCEKAILEMQSRGYENVYQLDGGILNYLQQFPHREFEGECFVFDHRVALDQELRPTVQYSFCPHCGQPGTIAITCVRCEGPARICHRCAATEEGSEETPREKSKRLTCSKDCGYHFARLHP